MADTEGFRELSKQLVQLAELDRGKVLRQSARLAVKPVETDAKNRIPVNDRDYLKKSYKGNVIYPGFAKDNIAIKILLSKDRQAAWALVGVKPEAFYAVDFVERGTSKQAAQPWLRPAFRKNRRRMVQRLGEGIRRKIMLIAKRGGK